MAGKNELEKFEYLFVDIEWNQTPGTNGIEDREPIQIGVVATDESMNLKKFFFIIQSMMQIICINYFANAIRNTRGGLTRRYVI